MQDTRRDIPAIGSFLKELQQIEVIKEFSLQPLELNQDNWNRFKSAVMRYSQEVNNVLASDTKTTEEVALQPQEISVTGSNQEENKNSNLYLKDDAETQKDTQACDMKKTNENEALQTEEVSDVVSNHKENKNSELDSKDDVENQMNAEACGMKKASEKNLQTEKVSDVVSNHKENNNSELDSKDDVENQMNAEACNIKKTNENEALQTEKVSDTDSNHEGNKNSDLDDVEIQVDVETCDTNIYEKAALQLRKSNQEENKGSSLLSKDDREMEVDKEISDKKTCENTALQLQEVSDMDSNRKKRKRFKSDSKDNIEMQMDTEDSDTKTSDNTALQPQEVSGMDSNQEENINHNKDNVQIQVSATELMRRINAFKLRKRKHKDEKNVQEYCGRPYIDELNPLWGRINTCARVDAVYIPRFDKKSRFKVTRVANRWGPQTQSSNEAAKRIKIEPESDTTEHTDNMFENIQARLQSLEAHVELNSDETVKKNVFERIKELEDRILYLEGLSPDYFNLPGPSYVPPRKNTTELENQYSNWSIDDIQKRIRYLRESLKAQSSTNRAQSNANKDPSGANKDPSGANKDSSGANKDSSGANKDPSGTKKDLSGANKDPSDAMKD
ncbi:MAP3K12-binding inhibitory protein 1 [Nephila pilipes]|uniref:MAP3K12-binding inhibitory protein 1 n=1 Tax=Nephila pilipes TaxID=299642 RepID=A0A8X6JN38_NEPPI|nr:MAP3K12-binding inhibitory protein 1 [Nephila pilipes]